MSCTFAHDRSHLGGTALWTANQGSLVFPVKVMAVTPGSNEVLVRPLNGLGEHWVRFSRLSNFKPAE